MRSLYGLHVKYTNLQGGEDSRLCDCIEPVNFTLGIVLMIDVTEAVSGNEGLVLKLVRAMETGDLPESIREMCTEEFVWENSGLTVINGQAELFEQMARGGFASQIPILKSMTHFSAELIHIASRDDIVFYRTRGSSLGRAGSRLDDTPYLWSGGDTRWQDCCIP